MAAYEQSQRAEHETRIGPFVAALAAVVIKSKPSNVTIQDYIQRACHALSGGRTRTSINDSQIDETCQRQLQQQLSDKDDQIKKLADENALLKAALAVSTDAVISGPPSNEHDQSQSEPLRAVAREPEAKTQELLRYLYLAQRLMSSASTCAATQLGRCLQKIIVTVAHLLQDHDTVRHQNNFSACTRAMTLVYRGVQQFSSDKDSSEQTRVIFAAVQLYSDLVRDYDYVEGGIEVQESGLGRTLKQENAMDNAAYMTNLTAFLIFLIDKLEPIQCSHRKLYEGYIFILTGTTGRQLYPAVFGCARGPTLEAEIRASEWTAADDSRGIMTADVPLQLLYLVKLLKHAVDRSSVFLVGDGSSHTTPVIRARLQHTLVEAIFGQDEVSAMSIQTLQLPAVHVSVEDSISQAQGMTTTEWFIREVWNIIGWDVISQ